MLSNSGFGFMISYDHCKLKQSSKALLGMASALVLSAVLVPSDAKATEGYMQNGVGAREKALAGAGVASSTDATAASLNPAGLVNVDTQAAAAISVLTMSGGYVSNGVGGLTTDGRHANEADIVTIPNLAVNWRLNWSWVDNVAFTIYANGGVSTHYADLASAQCPPGMSGVYCGGALGIKMQQTLFSVAFAKRLSPDFSIGIAPIVARQTISVEGAGFFAPFSTDPAHFTNQGASDSWGVGVRGGIEWKIAPWLRAGLSANNQISMTAHDKYVGLFTEHGHVDIPATIQAGIAIDLRPGLTMMLDYKHIWYGRIAAVANPSDNLFTIGALYGQDNGPGFGLRDLDVIKLGIEAKAAHNLTLRAGYSYNTAPLKGRDSDLNITTLGVVQHHVTGGLKYGMTSNIDLELSAMYAPKAAINGPELGFPTRNVEIHNSQFEFSVGAIYRFGEKSSDTPLK